MLDYSTRTPLRVEIERVKKYLKDCKCEKQWFDPTVHEKGYYLTLQLTEQCVLHRPAFNRLSPLAQFMIMTRNWDA